VKRTSIVVLATLLSLAAMATVAAAQPGLSPTGPEPPIEGDLLSMSGTGGDVLGDRAWMSPTALTQPEGSVTVSYLQLGPVGTAVGTYGVSDRMQLSGIIMKPFGEDGGLYMATAKLQIAGSGRHRLAIQGGITHFDEGTSEQFQIFGIGAAGTICLDAACRSLISGYLGTARVADDEERPIVSSVSLVASLTSRVKLVGELDHGFVRDSNGDDITLGWLGGRITSRSWAFDVGLVRPVGDDVDDVLPMVGLTYRGD
jgi:hypothetical protein